MFEPGQDDSSVNSIDRYKLQIQDTGTNHLHRRLRRRHIIMIAIAGVIGTGLFLGSGRTLSVAGPLGALLGYVLMASVTYASIYSSTELTVWAPVAGTFPHYATRWVDPALGFALGWNYVISFALSTGAQMTAATVLITYWKPEMSSDQMAGIIIAFGATIILFNTFGVRYFGDLEVLFSTLKFCLFIGLLVGGLVIDLGGGPSRDRIGFRWWKQPGPFGRPHLTTNPVVDQFLGFLSGLINASFSFQGMELVLIAASETESPRRNIPIAVKKLFWAICTLYLLGIIMVGMLVPWDEPRLVNSRGTMQSPFVIALRNAGVKGLPHAVNAAMFISALSACNTYLFAASRVLYGLAVRGHAPAVLTYCTRHGAPLWAVFVSGAPIFLSLMCINSQSATVFNHLVHVCATGGLFAWGSMNLTYIRFYAGLVAQELDKRTYGYHNSWQPWLAYWGLGWSIIFILINGLSVWFKWNVATFISSYLNIIIFCILYIAFKVVMRTEIWRPLDMKFDRGIPSLQETGDEGPEHPPRTRWERFGKFVF